MWGMMKGCGKGKGKEEKSLNNFPAEQKVWVGSLNPATTFKELQDHFAQVAKPLWAEVYTSKGGATTGGVAYKTAEEAAAAIAALAGSELMGVTVEVDTWTTKPGGGKAGGKAGGVKRKWNSDGMSSPPDWQMMQMMQMMKGMKGGWGKGDWGKGGKSWHQDSGKPGDESGGILGEFMGTVKSFSEKGGYGFIECEQIKALHGKDVFLHHDQLKGHKVGHTVTFTCFLTGKGAPQAKDLKSGLT